MEETQIVANVLSTTQLFVMRRYLTSVVGPCQALEVIELVLTKAIYDHQHTQLAGTICCLSNLEKRHVLL